MHSFNFLLDMKYFWTLVVISIITKSSFTSANNFFHLCIANVDGSRTCGISTHRKAQLGIDLRRNSIHQTWTVVSNDVAMVPLYEHLLTRSATTISQVKRSIRRGFVFVNGKKATNDVIVGKGDVIQLVSQTSERSFSNLNRSGGATVEVLFEDDHCAVVNKPQGMTIFPTSCVAGQPAGWSLKSALLISLRPFNSTSCLGPCTEEGNQTLRSDINLIDARIPLRRPQPVHRIDKGMLLSPACLPALLYRFCRYRWACCRCQEPCCFDCFDGELCKTRSIQAIFCSSTRHI